MSPFFCRGSTRRWRGLRRPLPAVLFALQPCRTVPEPNLCWDSQFSYDTCCFDHDSIARCFLGDQRQHSYCCQDGQGQLPIEFAAPSFDDAEILCNGFLVDPARTHAREILSSTHDLWSTCLAAYDALRQWPNRPILIAMVSASHAAMFDNFVTHFALQADAANRAAATEAGTKPLALSAEMSVCVDRLFVLTFDDESQDVCNALAQQQETLLMACVPPERKDEKRLPWETRKRELNRMEENSGETTFFKGQHYFAINWFKAAMMQLLFDLGATSTLWMDIDVVVVRPLLKQYFSPRSPLILVECEGVQIGGPSAPWEFAAQCGIGFASRLAKGAVDEWVRKYGSVDPNGDVDASGAPLRLSELDVLRENPHLYKCLSVSEFRRIPLPGEPMSPAVISFHFVITGRMWRTVPSKVSSHTWAKEEKMRQLDLWRPRLEWPIRADTATDQSSAFNVGACGAAFNSAAVFHMTSGALLSSSVVTQQALHCLDLIEGTTFVLFSAALSETIQLAMIHTYERVLAADFRVFEPIGVCIPPAPYCTRGEEVLATCWHYFLHYRLQIPSELDDLTLPKAARIAATIRDPEEVDGTIAAARVVPRRI